MVGFKLKLCNDVRKCDPLVQRLQREEVLFCQSFQTDKGPIFCLDLDEFVHLVIRMKQCPVQVELQKSHALPRDVSVVSSPVMSYKRAW